MGRLDDAVTTDDLYGVPARTNTEHTTREDTMHTCDLCRLPIRGEWDRMDAGVVLGARSPHPVTLTRDVNLHPDCLGAWYLRNHPELVTVRVAA